jgi:hypothetical protein
MLQQAREARLSAEQSWRAQWQFAVQERYDALHCAAQAATVIAIAKHK